MRAADAVPTSVSDYIRTAALEAARRDKKKGTKMSRGSNVDILAAEKAEQFIQAEVDRAPEALRRLGKFLASVLDEDHWKTAERMLLGAVFDVNGVSARRDAKKAERK